MNKLKPVILVVLDGWGIAQPSPGNAVTLAKTPNLDAIFAAFPHCQLGAAGELVGLPKGQPGNSEVGHLNMGAGKIVYQDLPRINMSIADGSFNRNAAFLAAFEKVKKQNSNLHLIGLIGPGGVHSFLEHFYTLLWNCRANQLAPDKVFIHVITDGRDSPPKSAKTYVADVEEHLKKIGIGTIATVMGRYYAMDRDNHWERIQKAYEALVDGKGEIAHSALEALENGYAAKRTDEFLLPTIIVKNNKPVALISNNDAVIFFDFRADRARQLTKAFVLKDFTTIQVTRQVYEKPVDESRPISAQPEKVTIKTFDRKTFLNNLFFVTMTQYEKGLAVSKIAFEPTNVPLPLSRVFAERQLHQLHIAETEKYAHVTFFFNGRREAAFPFEDRVIIPSPQVATYDLKPEMSSFEVTETIISKIRLGLYDFIIANFANLDMVGHTGVLPAGIKAVETIDTCIGKLAKSVRMAGGAMILTSDHGNVEEMINQETGDIDTEHSTSPVPCVLTTSHSYSLPKVLRNGILADVAPTILELVGIPKPSDMTGRSLLEN